MTRVVVNSYEDLKPGYAAKIGSQLWQISKSSDMDDDGYVYFDIAGSCSGYGSRLVRDLIRAGVEWYDEVNDATVITGFEDPS